MQEKEINSIERSTVSDPSPAVTIGIVTAPETPSEIIGKLVPDFSEFLSDYVDAAISWKVKVIVDPFTGAAETAACIMEEIEKVKEKHDWDYAVGVSDLPYLIGKKFLVAEADKTRAIGQVSLPTLGSGSMPARVRESILQLVSEIHHGSPSEGQKRQQAKGFQTGTGEREYLRNNNAGKLVEKGWLERISPIQRLERNEDESQPDVRFIADGRLAGCLRIIIGMIRANHPLQAFSAFKNIIAAAFTTGAFPLIFPRLWEFCDSYGWQRSTVLMLTALSALMIWMIISHNLWEKKTANHEEENTKILRRLYNITTILTLGTSVICYYIILFFSFFLITFLFIPPSLLESQTGVGRPVGIPFHMQLAWVTASLATWVGAVGAGLADEEKVLKATYGYRQYQRKQQAKKDREQEDSQRE